MGKIQTKFDSTIKQSEIIVKLTNTSIDESGKNYWDNQQEIQQTSMYGIQAPLIMINNIVVDFVDVLSFNLKCVDDMPKVSMVVRDRKRLTTTFDTPGIDNELRVQILPKFDNKYKKINLTFYMNQVHILNNIITINAEYKLSSYTSDVIKSFGEIDTYTLFETIAKETGLGFASNIDKTGEDKRWIYCDNKSYDKILSKEIRRSGGGLQIYDYWIDWWNNLNLVDVYERYNTQDPAEDMMIWVSGQNTETGEGIHIDPIEVPALLNNHPSNQTMELYVEKYSISQKPGAQRYMGTDRLYSTYEEPLNEYMDYLVQDGDVKKDIFSRYEYLGEVYGGYNYLLSERKRDGFLQKMETNEVIDVFLKTPLLGLIRGNKVDFSWYINSDKIKDTENALIEGETISKPESNNALINELPDEEEESKSNDGNFVLDKTISGQYLILGQEIMYKDYKWQYKLKLGRSNFEKPQIMNLENE